MGLRAKLGVSIALVVSLMMTVTGVLTLRSERQIYREEMQRRARSLLRSFAIPCTIALANNDTPTLDNYLLQFAQASHSMDLKYIAALDFKGNVVSHSDAGEFGKTYSDPFTKRAMISRLPVDEFVYAGDKQVLRIGVPMLSGLRWGTLQAEFWLDSVDRAIQRSRMRVLWNVFAVALSTTLLAYLILSWFVIRPVFGMSKMARQFGSGDMTARVRISNQDEIGELALQMNGMAEQLQGYTTSLEHNVAKRTEELAQANEKLQNANAQLQRLARTDELTGVNNRRYLLEQLEIEVRRAKRSSRPFTLIMLDVDHFKHYNDANGHPAGDVLLKKLAQLMLGHLRSTDFVARYGGEEFTVLLLDASKEEGVRTAEKLRTLIAEHPFDHAQNQPLGTISVSMGLAFFPDDAMNVKTLIDYADQALYHSKSAGRNRVSCWGDLAALHASLA